MSDFREKRIPNTPDEYYNLYNQCRNDELERHTIENAYDVLEKLLKKVTKRWIWILNKFNRIFSME